MITIFNAFILHSLFFLHFWGIFTFGTTYWHNLWQQYEYSFTFFKCHVQLAHYFYDCTCIQFCVMLIDHNDNLLLGFLLFPGITHPFFSLVSTTHLLQHCRLVLILTKLRATRQIMHQIPWNFPGILQKLFLGDAKCFKNFTLCGVIRTKY